MSLESILLLFVGATCIALHTETRWRMQSRILLAVGIIALGLALMESLANIAIR